jgi:hypothetical protein
MAFQPLSPTRTPNLLNWASLMQKTSESTSDGIHPYIYEICEVKIGEVNWYLEAKTPTEAEFFSNTHQRWDTIFRKLPFFDVICLSRIYLASEGNAKQKKLVTTALNNLADRAETKYNSGFIGTAQKILSFICNLFKNTNRVTLFDQILEIPPNANDRLPFFVGTDATFARLIAQNYSQDSSPTPSNK